MVSPTTTTTNKSSLPAGEYRIVAWDLDTTGRRLIDEICQIAAYYPNNNFSQYVMPYRDLDFISKRKHLIRTVNVGKYRMLKDIRTGKVLKTKSDITALQDFLSWLEKIHGDGPAILLLHYENFKLLPFLLLQALKKHNLLDRFTAVVRGFADCYALVKQRCEMTLKSFNLKTVETVLLSKEGDIANAGHRAELAYEVVQHLVAGESTGGDGDSFGTREMVNALLEHSISVAEELNAFEDLKVLLQRQNTLWPIFSAHMTASFPTRKKAVLMRRLLALAVFDYNKLKALWDENKKEALENGVKDKITDATEEQLENIIKVLVEHFDPDTQPSIPTRKPYSNNRGRYYSRGYKSKSSPKSNGKSSATPSETTTNTSASSPAKSNGIETPNMEESPKHELKVEELPKQPPKAEPINQQNKTAESPKKMIKTEESPKQQSKPETPTKSLNKTSVESKVKTAESPRNSPRTSETSKSHPKVEGNRKSPTKPSDSPKQTEKK